jgi:hypothetical protein
MAGTTRISIGDADLSSTNPLPVAETASATTPAKAEDEAHTSGETGVAILAVRRDTAAVGSNTDGDYSTVNVDATGRVWVNIGASASSIAKAEDAAHTTADVGVPALAVQRATPVVSSDSAGDYSTFNVDGQGRLYVNNQNTTAITFTPSVVAEATTAEDILFATEELANVGAVAGQVVVLRSVAFSDIDDQGDAQTLFFFNANTSLGTEGSTPDIDDTEILTMIGKVTIASGDWKDLGANRFGIVQPNIYMKLAGAATSIWVAGNTQGTPTHTAAGLQFQFVFERIG